MSVKKEPVTTVADVSTYKGRKVFAVWEVDQHGNPTRNYPVVSFGSRKANALLAHLEELKIFLDKEDE